MLARMFVICIFMYVSVSSKYPITVNCHLYFILPAQLKPLALSLPWHYSIVLYESQ